MKLSRLAAVIAATTLVGISLTGCATGSFGSSSSAAAGVCSSSTGDVASSIAVTGDVGSTPTSVSFDTPLLSTTTQTATVTKGTGKALTATSGWSIAYSLYQGSSTTALETSGYADSASESASSSSSSSALIIQPSAWATNWPGLAEGLSCGNVGDRIVIVMGTTENATFMSNLGLETTSSLIMVVDVLAGFDSQANGVAQTVPSLFPTVTLATDGQPGISTPSGNAPTSTTIGVLKKGSGATIHSSDTAVVQYSGWLWSDGTQFDTSWSSGKLFSASKSGVVAGFWKAIDGQTVGSQVIVIVPPDDGYGSTANGTIPANSTLVFVIDIVGTL